MRLFCQNPATPTTAAYRSGLHIPSPNEGSYVLDKDVPKCCVVNDPDSEGTGIPEEVFNGQSAVTRHGADHRVIILKGNPYAPSEPGDPARDRPVEKITAQLTEVVAECPGANEDFSPVQRLPRLHAWRQ